MDDQKDARDTRLATALATPGLVRHAVPAWGGAVMGTGIVGIAARTLPVQAPVLDVLASAAWLATVGSFTALLVVLVLQAVRYPQVAIAHLVDERTAPALGTLAMATLTVGTSTLLVGGPVLGTQVAIGVDAVLLALGTAAGVVVAVAVPLLIIVRPAPREPQTVAAVWLLPVVPPMVSAAAGGVLAQRLDVGATRSTLIVLCLMLGGLALVASLLTAAALWQQLLLRGPGAQATAPALWLVLGPLGQGATALHALAVAAHGDLPEPYPGGLDVVALVGGAALLGFAGAWSLLAGALTVRAHRGGLPFHLGWWAFTFPVGTCVTGLSGLASQLRLPALDVLALVAFAGLLAAWLLTASRTARAVRHGHVLSPLASDGPVPAPAPAAATAPTAP